jgi:hypothetical protein
MGVIHNPESEYSRELERWNLPKRLGGFNVNKFEPFPVMVYKAFARDNGKVMCGDPLAAVGDVKGEAFARQCQLSVKNKEDHDRAIKMGWSTSPDSAIELFEKNQLEISTATAERHYRDQRMSERARAEAFAADEATHAHVPDVPETKVRKKRGRPSKKAVSRATG